MSQGAIVFTADGSQVVDAANQSAEAVRNVASTAAEAKQKIIASWNEQIAAAEKLGASARQLEAINSDAVRRLANVTEESSQRSINSLKRHEDQIRKTIAARNELEAGRITQPVSSFSFSGFADEASSAKSLESAVEGVNAAHGRGVAPAVQFGSVLRGLEGNFSRNVRAAEAFGSSLGVLTPIIEFAFPIVGASVLAYAIFELGEKAYDAFENVVMLRDAIAGLNEMQIKVDSDHSRAQDSQEQSVESILEHTQGRSAALNQKYNYDSGKHLDLSSYFYSKDFKSLPDDVKGTFEQTYKNVAPADAQDKIKSITKTIDDLQTAIKGVKDHSIGAFLPVINGSGPSSTRDPISYYTAQLTAAQQIKSSLSDAADTRTAKLQGVQTDIGAADAEEMKKRSSESIAAQREAMQKQKEQWGIELAEWQADGDRTSGQIAEWWIEKAVAYSSNAQLFTEAMKKADEETIRVRVEYRTQLKEFAKQEKEILADMNKSAEKPDISAVNRDAKNYASYFGNLRAQGDEKQSFGYKAEDQSIRFRESTGAISKYDAALQLTALHTREYADAVAALREQQDQLDGNQAISTSSRLAEQSRLNLAKQQLDDNRSLTVAQDNATTNYDGTLPLTGAVNALDDFVNSTKDASRTVGEFTNTAIRGLNDTLVNAISTRQTPYQTHMAFANFGSSLFRSVVSTGLQKAEGVGLHALGFGGKADGSANNPLYVRLADATSSAAGSVGSFFSKLFGGSKGPGQAGLSSAFGFAADASSNDQSNGGLGLISTVASAFLPGLVIGGNADAHGSYLVGEHGPEVLRMGNQPGRVLPHIGGDVHHHYVDARGATNPAEVVAAVDRRIKHWAPALTAASVHAVHDGQLRRSPGVTK